MIGKFGGYQVNGDPRASSQYVATTGNGTAAGSFTVTWYVPIQAINRDGLGSLQNQSSASTFTLKLTVNTSAAIYSTAPTTVPTATIKIFEDGWWKSNKAGASTTPPKAGTTQYWTRGIVQRAVRLRAVPGVAGPRLPDPHVPLHRLQHLQLAEYARQR